MTYQNDKTPLNRYLRDYDHLRFHKVDETKWEALGDRLVDKHHDLGYGGQIGARIKYVITLGKQIVGAISFCSEAYRLGLRGEYMGWDDETRLSKLQHVISNNRFLILSWIQVRNLASHILLKSNRGAAWRLIDAIRYNATRNRNICRPREISWDLQYCGKLGISWGNQRV